MSISSAMVRTHLTKTPWCAPFAPAESIAAMSAGVSSTGRDVQARSRVATRGVILLTQVRRCKITLQSEFLGARPKEIRERDHISVDMSGTLDVIGIRDGNSTLGLDPGQ